jgi:hypothetical protein
VAPGHEKFFPAGNPKVLAIVGVFPLGETAFATFLSLERFSFMGHLSFFILFYTIGATFMLALARISLFIFYRRGCITTAQFH